MTDIPEWFYKSLRETRDFVEEWCYPRQFTPVDLGGIWATKEGKGTSKCMCPITAVYLMKNPSAEGVHVHHARIYLNALGLSGEQGEALIMSSDGRTDFRVFSTKIRDRLLLELFGEGHEAPSQENQAHP